MAKKKKSKEDLKKKREENIEKAIKLLNLRDGVDYQDSKRDSERDVADKKLNQIIESNELDATEIMTGISAPEEFIEKLRSVYGPFYPFVLFEREWERYRKIAYRNPCQTLEAGKEQRTMIKAYNDSIIADEDLENCIRAQLGLEEDREIGLEELRALRSLDASNSMIETVSGLEYAINLKQLDLSDNPLDDIKPIEHLGHLITLDLSHTDVENINALSSLGFLHYVSLAGLKLESLKPLLISKLLEFVNFSGANAIDEEGIIETLKESKVKVVR